MPHSHSLPNESQICRALDALQPICALALWPFQPIYVSNHVLCGPGSGNHSYMHRTTRDLWLHDKNVLPLSTTWWGFVVPIALRGRACSTWIAFVNGRTKVHAWVAATFFQIIVCINQWTSLNCNWINQCCNCIFYPFYRCKIGKKALKTFQCLFSSASAFVTGRGKDQRQWQDRERDIWCCITSHGVLYI